MQTSTLYKLFSLIQKRVEYIQPLQRIGKSFFNIALLIFLTFPIFSQATTAKLTRLNGSVEMTEAGKSVKPEVNSNLSLSTKIKTGEDGKVELLLDQSEYLILRNQEVVVKDLQLKNFISVQPTAVPGARGLYEKILVKLEKESAEAYRDYVKAKGSLENHNGWKKVIDTCFAKLIATSGKESFNLHYAIIKDNSFNAGAFPGGQFIIHVGTLDFLDKKIGAILKDKKESVDAMRESLLSAILSHELAHYYNKHAFQKVKKIIGDEGDTKTITAESELISIRFGQEMELDADMSGFLFYQKAGFDPSGMISMLKILNELQQEGLKNSPESIPYFTSHPSPHERLSQFPSDEKELHAWAFTMEKTFADIQLGQNLKAANEEITSALKKYKDNSELLKANAVCLHKIWLDTVSIEEQGLRSILSMPAFRDEMVFGGEKGTKGDLKIPGDVDKYYAAKDAYLLAFSKSPDAAFASNYSVLLSYSDEKKERLMAKLIGEELIKTPTVQNCNNLAVVYLQNSEEKKALEILRLVAPGLVEHTQKLIVASFFDENIRLQLTTFLKEIKLRQAANKTFVSDMHTPILNLAILETLIGDKKASADWSKEYLTSFDSDSKWAEYLSTKSGVSIASADTPSKPVSLEGVELDNTQKQLISKWGEADSRNKNGNSEFLIYKKYGAVVTLEKDIVTEIKMTDSTTFALSNKLKLGAKQEEVEKLLGKKAKRKGNNYLYSGKSKLALRYISSKLVEILVYK
ncbi:MAG: M48 family metallopeptidase [Leptospiraceae bacterium]|nr:M48 family metallopeptidase [Leptospiraceae bacterium]